REHPRVGGGGGDSDGSWNRGPGTDARAAVDSYPRGAYLGHEIGALRLPLGAAHSWHRIGAQRDVQVGGAAGKEKTKHDAQSTPEFTEAASRIHTQPATLEPTANPAYLLLHPLGSTENGAAAARSAGCDHAHAALPNQGLRPPKSH
ncbi:autotransporter domain-containing protein, partial [Pseudomonas syringae]